MSHVIYLSAKRATRDQVEEEEAIKMKRKKDTQKQQFGAATVRANSQWAPAK